MIQKSTMWAIASVFFKEPTKEHTLKEIGRQAGIAHTSATLHLKTLLAENIVEKRNEQKGTRRFPLYHAHIGEEYLRYKRASNLLNLWESGLLQYLRDACAPSCIVVFGSYDRGEDVEKSDIDIYIQAERRTVDVRRYEKLLSRKIQIQYNKDFASYPSELKNNIINGTVLYGYLEAFA